MLTENKFSKYVIYAIGEIVLVVVGILIALQINNWNQQRQQNSSIQQGLLEVRNNLVIDSLQMTKTIKKTKEELKIQQKIILVLENGELLDSTYNKNLGKCMVIENIRVTQNGYRTLQNIGLETIKNKDLKNQLIRYYDISSKSLEAEFEDDRKEFTAIWLPFVRENFKDFDYRNYAIPKNYEHLSLDLEFLIMLKLNMNNRGATLRVLKEMQINLRNLLKKI